jgi:AcrR family transcriptional regulator
MESGGSDVRRRILRAATEVFADKGYAGASIADISSAARVTKPMLYYYFGDKAGLFDAVIEQVHGRLKQGLSSRIRDDRSATDQLADIAELVFEATREQPTVSRLQFAAFFGTSTGAAREILMACAYLVYESILEVVELGLTRGELCGKADEVATLVHGAINMRVMSSFSGDNALPPVPGEGRRTISLLVRGIGHAAEYEARPRLEASDIN